MIIDDTDEMAVFEQVNHRLILPELCILVGRLGLKSEPCLISKSHEISRPAEIVMEIDWLNIVLGKVGDAAKFIPNGCAANANQLISKV